jgi:hypothetical protein
MNKWMVVYFTMHSQYLDYIASVVGWQVNDDEYMTNINALSGIRTHDLSGQVIKAYASECMATGTS